MANTEIVIRGCKVTFWKHTYHIKLPHGPVYVGSSYQPLTVESMGKEVGEVLAVFEAGKAAQRKEIRTILGIR